MTLEERRKREIEKRRETVIDVANDLFYSKGYENVTMDDIAREAEISRTTIYSYFKDKESLLFAVVNRGIKKFENTIEHESRRQNESKNHVITTATYRFLLKYPHFVRAYFFFRSGKFDLSSDIKTNPDVIEITEITKKLFHKIVSENENSIEYKSFKSDINPAVLTAFNFLVFEGIIKGITIEDPLVYDILNVYGITFQQFQAESVQLLKQLFSKIDGF